MSYGKDKTRKAGYEAKKQRNNSKILRIGLCKEPKGAN